MSRDFTYIDDLVSGMYLLFEEIPWANDLPAENALAQDSKSPVAPFRVVNIGNSEPAQLLDFIRAIEKSIGITAVKNFMPMQAGDVPRTWADNSLLQSLTGYKLNTNIDDGIQKFVAWYREYYNV